MAPAFKRRRLAARDEDFPIRIDKKRRQPSTDSIYPESLETLSRLKGTSKQLLVSGQHQSENLELAMQSPQLLQLKVDDLLELVESSPTSSSVVSDAVHLLKELIWRIPDRRPQSFLSCEKSHRLPNASVPFHLPVETEKLNYQLAYARPNNVTIIDNNLRVANSRNDGILTFEIDVEMPGSLFQAKDFLDYRYFHKRAFYLACLASGILADAASKYRLRYFYKDDIALNPLLLIELNSVESDTGAMPLFHVIINPRIGDAELFSKAKTLPGQRRVTAKQNHLPAQSEQDVSNFYCSCFRAGCVEEIYRKLVHNLKTASDAYRGTCALGEIWLRQRGFNSSLSGGGFGAFEWSLMVALLLIQSQKDAKVGFAQGYTSLQMFQATLQFLSSKDLVRTHQIIRYDQASTKPDLDSLAGPVFFDYEEGLNILYKMSSSSYLILRHAATRSSKLLSDPLIDQFQALFIRKSMLKVYQYDMLVRIPLREAFTKTKGDLDRLWLLRHTQDRLFEILRKGLGDRVLLIDVNFERSKSWNVNLKDSKDPIAPMISIYLLFDSQTVDRAIDKGPPIEEKVEADDFRSLWGEKAELRRFQDGRILEAVVWPVSLKGHTVISQIVSHLLRTHIIPENVNSLEIFEAGDEVVLPNESRNKDQTSSYQSLIESFEQLEDKLRDIKTLPLQIRQISPADPILYRMSAKGSHEKQGVNNSAGLANLIVQFEASSRWPNSLAAIRRSKIAFLLKISELVENSDSGISTRLGLGRVGEFPENDPFLDYYGSDGNAFRLRLHVDNEGSLLKEELQLTVKSRRGREAAAQALSDYKRDYFQRPRHSQAMRAAMTRHRAFAPSVLLLKKWRDCHLLANHFADELLELLVIRAFVHPGQYAVPGSAIAAFYLTLLFISTWDWRTQPFIVSINGELSRDDIVTATTHFRAWRKIDPAMNKIVMFAASNLDLEGITWTGSSPSIVAATRFTSLAKAATARLRAAGHCLPPATLFQTSLGEYDFIMHLQTDKNRQALNDKSHDVQSNGLIAPFLNELDQLYGDYITFFYSQSNGKSVGGLWKPNTKLPRWKKQVQEVNKDFSAMTPMHTAIINEIANVGRGLITEIKFGR